MSFTMTGVKILGTIKAGAVSAASTVDSYFTRVALLLNGDSVAGTSNRTFVDSSSNNYTIATTYEPKQGSFSPHAPAGYSNYFNGSYMSTNSLTPLGAGDWTVECFINTNDQDADTGYFQLSPVTGGFQAGAAWINSVSLMTTNNMLRIYINSGAYTSTATLLKRYTWYHIAIVKHNNNIRVYVDGVLDTTFGVAGDTPDTHNYTGSSVVIGGGYSTSFLSNTYISNFRITGNAVYTSAFTPPTSTLTADSNTRLLVANSRSFADLSPNNLILTRTGVIQVTTTTPFTSTNAYTPAVNGGSAQFNLSSGVIVPQDALLFGTGDFTIESWVYHTGSFSNYANMFWTEGAQPIGMRFGDSGLGFKLQFAVNGTAFSTIWNIDFTQGSKMHSWYHVAFTRESGVCRVFIDGKQQPINNGVNPTTYPFMSFTDNTNITAPGTGTFGRSTSAYMSDMRVVKGTAVYTADFDLPTAPLLPVPDTSVLLNCAAAAVVDRTAKQDFNTKGALQVSGTQSKFRETSIHFNGSSMDSAIASDQYVFANDCDYTIECWYYATLPNFSIIDHAITNSTIQITSINGNMYHGNQTWTYSSPTDQWVHLAFSRAAGVLRLFANGVLIQSQANSNVIGIAQAIQIGRSADGNYVFNGFLDDLRITKGVGRYTAAFAPPTEAFPVK